MKRHERVMAKGEQNREGADDREAMHTRDREVDRKRRGAFKESKREFVIEAKTDEGTEQPPYGRWLCP